MKHKLKVGITLAAVVVISTAVAVFALPTAATFTVESTSPANTLPTAASVLVSGTKDVGLISYTVTASAAGQPTLKSTLTPLSTYTTWQIPLSGLVGGASYSFIVTTSDTSGSTNSTAQTFTPKSIPTAPSANGVTTSQEQATVNWIAPTTDGGSVITSYTITAGAQSWTALGSASSITINKLTAGASYAFAIYATNAIGKSSEATYAKVTIPDTVVAPVATASATASASSSASASASATASATPPPPIYVPAPAPLPTPTPTPTLLVTPTPSPVVTTATPAPVASTKSAEPTSVASSTPTPTSTPSATPSQTVSANKSVGGGITVVGSSLGKSATKIIVAKPGNSIAKAPQIGAVVGKAITPTIKALPKSTAFKASVVINAKTYTLGSVKTNSSGVATLPAFSAAKAGTYSVQLTTAKGVKYFIKLVVKSKK